MDYILDERGTEIIDLCMSNQKRIINGRLIGDLHGQYINFLSLEFVGEGISRKPFYI